MNRFRYGDSAQFDERVAYVESGGMLGRSVLGVTLVRRYVELRRQLRELSAQWVSLTGAPAAALNPIGPGETWEQRFLGRLAVAKESINRIKGLLNQVASRMNQNPEADITDLVNDIDGSVTTYNAAIKEAYAIYARRLVSWTYLDRLSSTPTLGGISMGELEELTNADLQAAGNAAGGVAGGLGVAEGGLTIADNLITGVTALTGVSGLFTMWTKQTFKVTAKKVVGAIVVGYAVNKIVDGAVDAIGVGPTTRRVIVIAGDIVQLLLYKRKLRATNGTNGGAIGTPQPGRPDTPDPVAKPEGARPKTTRDLKTSSDSPEAGAEEKLRPKSATNAVDESNPDIGRRRLRPPSLQEIIDAGKIAGGNAENVANAMRPLLKLKMQLEPMWEFHEFTGRDGAKLFTGRAGEAILVAPNGRIFRCRVPVSIPEWLRYDRGDFRFEDFGGLHPQ